ncbi:trehalose-phosphatase [Buchananella hordeovulneris]|uniref:trehalose-phosphatase n=1 Tax=Buchananella hordeovulneris TaxID=52770 RepID=UPI0026DD527D|nr:trehalose-phosphatase [Buchananella hordeovulneris]MDO5081197.1 trehalose-phosphatase [Buchananella hordeovulneris]
MTKWQELTPAAAHFCAVAASDPGGVLLALDFDGTLADIVPDPTDARLHPGAAAALARLGPHLGQIAIITGRAVTTVCQLGQLLGRPGLERLVVLGQYGAERWHAADGPPPAGQASDRIAVARVAVEQAAAEWPGVHVEDKGSALVLHTRRAAQPERAFAALQGPAQAIAAAHDLVLEPGRCVLELRASRVNKGDALRSLLAELRPRAVAMCGDDLGDLPAFAAVREAEPEVTGCVVVSGSPETSELVEMADVVAAGPAGVAAWLTALADQIAAGI